ncbi:hypothetical protein HZA55_04600 [Candidatus Poribacteria bacterium]|nr:hypothetical protein [Candidatus Poribacteria bacterium]
MIAFCREYPDLNYRQKIPWGHNILLMEKVKELSARLWYIENIIENGWSRDDLESMIMI